MSEVSQTCAQMGIHMTITVPNWSYEQVDAAERERARQTLQAELRLLDSVQHDLEHTCRDIANLIESVEETADLHLAAAQCSELAARLRDLARERCRIETATKETT